MTKDELLDQLLAKIKEIEAVESASRIDGEDAIGVEMNDGAEYFIELADA